VLGQPDVGLLTMSEMVSRAAALAAVNWRASLIADADTGYATPSMYGALSMSYERAGVAAIHIEDQVWPKKCGHMEGKQVIPSMRWSKKSVPPLMPGGSRLRRYRTNRRQCGVWP